MHIRWKMDNYPYIVFFGYEIRSKNINEYIGPQKIIHNRFHLRRWPETESPFSFGPM